MGAKNAVPFLSTVEVVKLTGWNRSRVCELMRGELRGQGGGSPGWHTTWGALLDVLEPMPPSPPLGIDDVENLASHESSPEDRVAAREMLRLMEPFFRERDVTVVHGGAEGKSLAEIARQIDRSSMRVDQLRRLVARKAMVIEDATPKGYQLLLTSWGMTPEKKEKLKQQAERKTQKLREFRECISYAREDWAKIKKAALAAAKKARRSTGPIRPYFFNPNGFGYRSNPNADVLLLATDPLSALGFVIEDGILKDPSYYQYDRIDDMMKWASSHIQFIGPERQGTLTVHWKSDDMPDMVLADLVASDDAPVGVISTGSRRSQTAAEQEVAAAWFQKHFPEKYAEMMAEQEKMMAEQDPSRLSEPKPTRDRRVRTP